MRMQDRLANLHYICFFRSIQLAKITRCGWPVGGPCAPWWALLGLELIFLLDHVAVLDHVAAATSPGYTDIECRSFEVQMRTSWSKGGERALWRELLASMKRFGGCQVMKGEIGKDLNSVLRWQHKEKGYHIFMWDMCVCVDTRWFFDLVYIFVIFCRRCFLKIDK